MEKYLTPRLNGDFIEAGVDEDKMHFWFVLKPDSNSIEPLIEKMQAFGWFCSTNTMVDKGLYLQFEPKFDIFFKNDELPFEREGDITFYHIAPSYLKEKIMTNGLEPRSKNNFLKYPDRMYLFPKNVNRDEISSLAEMLYAQDTNPTKDGKYSLFGVKIRDLNDIKIYPDRNMFDIVGYFTYDNIPPSNVTHVEDFSVSLR